MTVMSWDEWTRKDAQALAGMLRNGEVTPRELAEQVAAGIARVNPALSAVVEIFDDVVADPLHDGMQPGGPFAGVPYLMKDLGPMLKGRRQEMGARLMRGNQASSDSFLTQKIRAAGLNIIGRTTTPEFGVCGSAENPGGPSSMPIHTHAAAGWPPNQAASEPASIFAASASNSAATSSSTLRISAGNSQASLRKRSARARRSVGDSFKVDGPGSRTTQFPMFGTNYIAWGSPRP